MSIQIPTVEIEPTCATCAASCCRMEVLLITETGVPHQFISIDKWGAESMRQLDDGWCAALDRGSMLCTIYEQRPFNCREFEMSSPDCLAARIDPTLNF